MLVGAVLLVPLAVWELRLGKVPDISRDERKVWVGGGIALVLIAVYFALVGGGPALERVAMAIVCVTLGVQVLLRARQVHSDRSDG